MKRYWIKALKQAIARADGHTTDANLNVWVATARDVLADETFDVHDAQVVALKIHARCNLIGVPVVPSHTTAQALRVARRVDATGRGVFMLGRAQVVG